MKADKSMQRRHWLMGGVALAAVAGGGIYAWQATRDMRSNDEAVDAFWALQLQQPDGQMLALQSLRGRPLLVNFWATWCPPCVRELPMLDRFAQKQAQRGSQGVQMLGLAVDQAASVQRWLQRQPLSFPVALTGTGGVTLTRSLGNISGGLPFSLLFDGQGRLQQRKIGELSPQDLQQWAAQV